MTQGGKVENLKGAHWNQCVRGMTVVAIKLLCDYTDKTMIKELSSTYSDRIMKREKERRKKNKLWRALEKQVAKRSQSSGAASKAKKQIESPRQPND